MPKASLVRANLSYANLISADLDEADISDAKLSYADLFLAMVTDVNLKGTDLHGANLNSAVLNRSDLTDATVGSTVFACIPLATVNGLDTVRHSGPSTVGIDTIYPSGGRIPEVFLRGCGVPDDFITYAKSLVANPIQFYSCFISYSTKDDPFADRLYADLQNKGVRCWFAPHDVQGSRKLHEQIDEAIRLHDKLLLILSPHSMESEWVKTEIAKARKREVRDKRRVLFPIRLAPFETLRDWECFDADTGKDSAREIREYFIPDFSNWKNHDSYQEAFQRLVSDLKASDSKPT
jgi:TIR domain/Pentapeptide repeats (8 copies)